MEKNRAVANECTIEIIRVIFFFEIHCLENNQILILHFLGHCAMQGIFSFKIPQLTNSKSFKAWRERRLNFVIY